MRFAIKPCAIKITIKSHGEELIKMKPERGQRIIPMPKPSLQRKYHREIPLNKLKGNSSGSGSIGLVEMITGGRWRPPVAQEAVTLGLALPEVLGRRQPLPPLAVGGGCNLLKGHTR